jgi:hypothetical protein
MQCAAHPDVETELACSRCGTAICPRCLVHTPVGARCRECANIRRIPAYNLSASVYVRAIAAAMGVGAATGVAWWLFNALTYGGIFVFVVGIGMGYAVGETVSLAANRRAGPPLQVIAVAGVILAYAVRTGLLIVVDDWTLSALRVIDAFALVAVALAGFIAVQRLR